MMGLPGICCLRNR